MPRKYQLKRRAEHQQETRRQIIEATVHLHETVGTSKTTIRAIADQAGVERLTVYRHFPSEHALFTACTSHYLTDNPPPDPARWQDIANAEKRLRKGLTEIYAYHRRTEPMFTRTARDLDENPVLREILTPFFTHWAHVREVLCAPWKASGPARIGGRAFIGHAIRFQTWRSLVREQKLKEADAVKLLVKAALCIFSDAASKNK
jgi:AcrR family transcriptional regulator